MLFYTIKNGQESLSNWFLNFFLLDIFEEYMFFSPSATAKSYLKEACKKRKNTLTEVITFINEILNMDPSQRNPRQKDGALHVLGSLADLLAKVLLFSF